MDWTNLAGAAVHGAEMCTILFRMGHCGLWGRCTVGIVGLEYGSGHEGVPVLVPGFAVIW